MSQDLFTRQCNCPEIQNVWEPEVGDEVCAGYPCGIIIKMTHDKFSVCNSNAEISWVYRSRVYWLPPETDLWAMLPRGRYRLNNYVYFYRLEKKNVVEAVYFYSEDEATAQQALIQGVMWELHQKKWDNEKGWVR